MNVKQIRVKRYFILTDWIILRRMLTQLQFFTKYHLVKVFDIIGGGSEDLSSVKLVRLRFKATTVVFIYVLYCITCTIMC